MPSGERKSIWGRAGGAVAHTKTPPAPSRRRTPYGVRAAAANPSALRSGRLDRAGASADDPANDAPPRQAEQDDRGQRAKGDDEPLRDGQQLADRPQEGAAHLQQ